MTEPTIWRGDWPDPSGCCPCPLFESTAPPEPGTAFVILTDDDYERLAGGYGDPATHLRNLHAELEAANRIATAMASAIGWETEGDTLEEKAEHWAALHGSMPDGPPPVLDYELRRAIARSGVLDEEDIETLVDALLPVVAAEVRRNVVDARREAEVWERCADEWQARWEDQDHQWVKDHPAEAARALIDAGHLVRQECEECNDRGDTHDGDGWPEPCPACYGGREPLYRLALLTEEAKTDD